MSKSITFEYNNIKHNARMFSEDSVLEFFADLFDLPKILPEQVKFICINEQKLRFAHYKYEELTDNCVLSVILHKPCPADVLATTNGVTPVSPPVVNQVQSVTVRPIANTILKYAVWNKWIQHVMPLTSSFDASQVTKDTFMFKGVLHENGCFEGGYAYVPAILKSTENLVWCHFKYSNTQNLNVWSGARVINMDDVESMNEFDGDFVQINGKTRDTFNLIRFKPGKHNIIPDFGDEVQYVYGEGRNAFGHYINYGVILNNEVMMYRVYIKFKNNNGNNNGNNAEINGTNVMNNNRRRVEDADEPSESSTMSTCSYESFVKIDNGGSNVTINHCNPLGIQQIASVVEYIQQIKDNIESLTIGYRCGDNNLLKTLAPVIISMPKLRYLDVHRCKLAYAEGLGTLLHYFSFINNLPLEYFEMSYVSLTETNPEYLASVIKRFPIKNLQMQWCSGMTRDIRAVRDAYLNSQFTLKVFNYAANKTDDDAMECIADMLNHERCSIIDLDLHHCKAMNNVKLLRAIANSKSLREINLASSDLEIKNLADVITSNSCIQIIKLEHIHDADVEHVARMLNTCTNITDVSLSIDDTYVKVLNSKVRRHVTINVIKPKKNACAGNNNNNPTLVDGVQGLLTLCNKRKADEM
jgi:hypothetical protein